MSEENQVQEKKSNCKLLVVLVIISLLLSIASLSTSVYMFVNGNAAGEGGQKKVVISKQYDKGKSLAKAKETGKPILVFFYTDWCGFCQRFVPTYDKISKNPKIKKNFAVAYVNCEDENNRKDVEEFGVQGFPTVYVIDAQGKKTQLENSTFFNNDSKDVVAKKALELIGQE